MVLRNRTVRLVYNQDNSAIVTSDIVFTVSTETEGGITTVKITPENKGGLNLTYHSTYSFPVANNLIKFQKNDGGVPYFTRSYTPSGE